ncbi:nucleotide-binding oligomerization domain-containing protein 1-like [Pocillopora verrucosa]|uniref:nucleotide-binding oligomerization domain-containing protein 1-like n=1 Tax=Pocillopora verrucosa TaxID=203993 RepID=UPI00333F10FB
MENSEPRLDFHCGGAKSEHINLVRGKCYDKYQEQYNKFALPVYGFVIMNFALIIFVCVIYSQIVKPTVNRLSQSIRNHPERQSRNQENALSTGYKLFIAYCCQLSTRLVLGVVFIILQTQLLYPLKFSSKFHCYLTDGTTQPRNSSDNAQHSTLHDCHNQRAVKKTSWMDAVLVVNGIFVVAILIEIVYIFLRACKERDFMQNSKFQASHLNPPEESQQQEERIQLVINITHEPVQQEERTQLVTTIAHEPQQQEEITQLVTTIAHEPQQQEEITQLVTNIAHEPQQQEEITQLVTNIAHEPQQLEERREHGTNIPQEVHQVEESKDDDTNIPHLPSGPEQIVKSPLQEFIRNTKKMIIDDTYQPPQLRSLFPSPPGKGHPPKHLTLDQIYTNLVVVPDMAEYDFTEDRRNNLQIYARSGEKNETPRGPEDILNHENKNILIVGRPGIGKTLSCTKILRDWASNKVFHKTPDDKIHCDVAFFVKFRLFNAATDLSLRELMTRSTYSPRDELDEQVWNYILENPQKVLLIFDGLDEFKFNSEISKKDNEPQFRNKVDEKMPLSALYAKLTTGKLLNGAAVITTTRPTALSCIESIPFHKIFEILGFSSEQVEEYVTKFAEEDKEAGDTVKRHITSNINILSLCYIPASCFIICSSLFKMVKFHASKGLNLPTSLTDIYEKAVKIFYLRHTEEFRDKHFTRKDFESNDLPREEEKKLEKLEKLAFEGIKEGRLIFGANEVRGMEDSALFHRLPDREVDSFSSEGQFCFIHLTMQEFFAAKHLTNNMSETELRNFVQMNIKEGKWQLVFQFVAGLMKNKKNLPREIITDLLPVKTEEKEDAYHNVQCTENKKETKVTCWPTRDKRDLAVTLIKCFNENSRMKSEAQRKLQQINFNYVNITRCHLTAVDCSSLVNVINLQQISHLDLTSDNIGPLGCLEICKLLKCRESQLSWLNLTWNQLTDEAAKYLAEAINNNNCQLRTLDLTSNNISDIGAQHLAEAINNNNCQLRTLYLTLNKISDTGAQHLAEAINNNNNCQLRTLYLSYNNITEAGEQKAHNLLSNIQSKCKLYL